MNRPAARLLASIAEMVKRAHWHSGGPQPSRQEALELVAGLSEQEKVLLEMMVDGWGPHEIARLFAIDAAVFERRRFELFRKINARTTADAVRLGISAGLC